MQVELELLRRGLPKWPQMWTTGKPVTVEQAKEIIRRTDTFFSWGRWQQSQVQRLGPQDAQDAP